MNLQKPFPSHMLPEVVPFNDELSSLPPLSGSLESCLSINPVRADLYFANLREHSQVMPNALAKGPGIMILEIPPVAVAMDVENDWQAAVRYAVGGAYNSGSEESTKNVPYTATNPISPSGYYLSFRPSIIGGLESYLSSSVVDIGPQSATPVADHLSLLYSELDELGSLGDDWNSEGAARIDAGALAQAKALIFSAESITGLDLPSIGPLPDGRVSLTWEFEQKELWVYASAGGFTSYRWNTQEQFKSDVSIWQEPSRILEFLEWLMK